MADFSAIAKWPNVPACYEWLSLDRRGDWRLQGERVTHRGLIDFLNKQYASDESGRWFVQNGPQRVYVDLACTPWIYRREGESFVSHTGQPAGDIKAIYLDPEGNLLIDAQLGIGLLDDRDLASLLGECVDAHGQPTEETAFAALLEGQNADVFWRGHALQPTAAVHLEKSHKFIRQPRP